MDTVERNIPFVWRADDYPMKGQPNYAMTADEVKLALEGFQPVPINVEHIRSIFDGKLGHFTDPKPSADFTQFGGKLKIPRWLNDIIDQEPPENRGLSCTWDTASKRLKSVALTLSPRLKEAVFTEPEFQKAIFSSTAQFDIPPSQATIAAAPPAGLQSGSVTITGDPAMIAQLSDMATKMGLTVNAGGAPSTPPPGGMTAPMSTATAPTPAELEMRDRMNAMQRQIDDAVKRNAELEKAQKDAEFSAKLADSKTRIERELNRLWNEKRLTPATRDQAKDDLLQAAKDDLLYPTEVNFSEGGETKKGGRLDKLLATLRSFPPHNLTAETIPDRDANFADLPNRSTTPAGPAHATTKTKEDLLKLSDFGRAAAREKAKSNGQK